MCFGLILSWKTERTQKYDYQKEYLEGQTLKHRIAARAAYKDSGAVAKVLKAVALSAPRVLWRGAVPRFSPDEYKQDRLFPAIDGPS